MEKRSNEDEKLECHEFFTPFNSEYVNKSIELKTLKDVLRWNQLAIAQKNKKLEQEEENLNEIYKEVWRVKDAMCDEFWKFSNDHDFDALINEFPNHKNKVKCPCLINEEKIARDDTVSRALQDPEIRKLTAQVEKLESEIEALKSEETLDQEIKKSEAELAIWLEDNDDMKKQKAELSSIQKELKLLHEEIENTKMRNEALENAKSTKDTKKPTAQFEDSFYRSFSSLFSDDEISKVENDADRTSIEDNFHEEDCSDDPNNVRNPNLGGFVKAKTLHLRNQKNSELYQESFIPKKQIKLENQTCVTTIDSKNCKPENLQALKKFVVKKPSAISRNVAKNIKLESQSDGFDWNSFGEECKPNIKALKKTFVVKKQSNITQKLLKK